MLLDFSHQKHHRRLRSCNIIMEYHVKLFIHEIFFSISILCISISCRTRGCRELKFIFNKGNRSERTIFPHINVYEDVTYEQRFQLYLPGKLTRVTVKFGLIRVGEVALHFICIRYVFCNRKRTVIKMFFIFFRSNLTRSNSWYGNAKNKMMWW